MQHLKGFWVVIFSIWYFQLHKHRTWHSKQTVDLLQWSSYYFPKSNNTLYSLSAAAAGHCIVQSEAVTCHQGPICVSQEAQPH